MRRGKLPRHLMQKVPGGFFYVTLDIPKDVRPWFGNKPRFVKSLQTDSMTIAERLKWKFIEHWKTQIALARTGGSALEQIRIDIQDTPEGLDRIMLQEAHHSVAVDAAIDGDPTILEAYNTAYSGWVRLEEVVPKWIDRKKKIDQIAEKTFDDYHSIIRAFVGRFTYLHEVNKAAVREWLGKQEVQLRRKKLWLTAIRGFLAVAGADKNLLDGVLIEADIPKDKRKKRKSEARRHLEDGEIATLYKAARETDPVLSDLILLGAYTGCRIEELCSLRVEHATTEALTITDAKTEAGDRTVPVHKKLRQLVARLLDESKDGYLLTGLTFNKYGDRSNAIGKRFGRLKTSLGFDNRIVFHSLRKSFITKLERSGVPESTIARLVGHEINERTSLALGLYSGGLSIEQLRPAVDKVEYSWSAPTEVVHQLG
jgi:integrase